MNKHTKQVIVVRKDLNMRKGKIAAQAAHASMAVITNGLRDGTLILVRGVVAQSQYPHDFQYNKLNEDPIHQWFQGSFTKICVSCNSEEELLALHKEALNRQLPCALITDNGLTEFNGVKTNTCIALGPFWSEDIDAVTGKLPLL